MYLLNQVIPLCWIFSLSFIQSVFYLKINWTRLTLIPYFLRIAKKHTCNLKISKSITIKSKRKNQKIPSPNINFSPLNKIVHAKQILQPNLLTCEEKFMAVLTFNLTHFPQKTSITIILFHFSKNKIENLTHTKLFVENCLSAIIFSSI